MKTLFEEDEEFTYYQTMDYNRFKFLDINREVTNNRMLRKSMDIIDLTKYVPIIVTPDYYIIDGQHRFEQCKERGLPIYYIVYSGNVEEAMVALNTTIRNWKHKEWLHYYIAKKNPVYFKFRAMTEGLHVDISNAMILFSNGKTNSTDFKKGKLIDDSQFFERVVRFIDSTALPDSTKKYRAFVVGVLQFFRKYSNETKRINKLRDKILAIKKFANADDYMQAFENLTKK